MKMFKYFYSILQLWLWTVVHIMYTHPVSLLCVQLTVTEQQKQTLCRCILRYVYCCYCCSDQQSVCLTSGPVALTVSPTVQTAHHTIAIVTNSQSALTVALIVSPRVQTAHLTIPIVTNSQSALPVALLH